MVAAGSVQNQARGSALGASFKGDLVVSHLNEEDLLAFGKQFKLRPGDGLAADRVTCAKRRSPSRVISRMRFGVN